MLRLLPALAAKSSDLGDARLRLAGAWLLQCRNSSGALDDDQPVRPGASARATATLGADPQEPRAALFKLARADATIEEHWGRSVELGRAVLTDLGSAGSE
jgi:hypothetical protein